MTPKRQTNRAFGFTFAVVFMIVFAVAGLVWDVWLQWALVVAAVLVCVALVTPGLLLPFNRLWGALAGFIAVANNHLLLGLFFFMIVTPVGLTMRLFGWDPMTRRRSEQTSFWTGVTRHTDRASLKDMF